MELLLLSRTSCTIIYKLHFKAAVSLTRTHTKMTTMIVITTMMTMITFSRFIDFIADSIALTTPAIDDVTCTTHTHAHTSIITGFRFQIPVFAIWKRQHQKRKTSLFGGNGSLNASCDGINTSAHSPIIQSLILLSDRVLSMYLGSLHVTLLDCLKWKL